MALPVLRVTVQVRRDNARRDAFLDMVVQHDSVSFRIWCTADVADHPAPVLFNEEGPYCNFSLSSNSTSATPGALPVSFHLSVVGRDYFSFRTDLDVAGRITVALRGRIEIQQFTKKKEMFKSAGKSAVTAVGKLVEFTGLPGAGAIKGLSEAGEKYTEAEAFIHALNERIPRHRLIVSKLREIVKKMIEDHDPSADGLTFDLNSIDYLLTELTTISHRDGIIAVGKTACGLSALKERAENVENMLARILNACVTYMLLKFDDVMCAARSPFPFASSEDEYTKEYVVRACSYIDALPYGSPALNQRNERGYTSLTLAVFHNCTKLVQLLLARGADVDANSTETNIKLCINQDVEAAAAVATDGHGKTALYVAAEMGNVDMMRLLIQNRADITATASNGCTALHVALLRSRSEDIFHLLVSGGTSVPTASGKLTEPTLHASMKTVAVHIAIECNHWDLVPWLVERGADVNNVDARGHTPLHRAVRWCQVKCIDALLAHGANITIPTQGVDGITVASTALETLRARIMLADQSRAAVHEAAVREAADVLKALLSSATKDVERVERIHAALRQMHPRLNKSVLQMLVGLSRADIVADVLQILPSSVPANLLLTTATTAVEDGNHAAMAALVTRFPEFLSAALCLQCLHKGWRDVATTFIRHVDALDDELRRHAICIAVECGEHDVITRLVNRGANVNATSLDGHTALHRAATRGDVPAIQVLLSNGADITVASEDGSTPALAMLAVLSRPGAPPAAKEALLALLSAEMQPVERVYTAVGQLGPVQPQDQQQRSFLQQLMTSPDAVLVSILFMLCQTLIQLCRTLIQLHPLPGS